jgi:hypothetical protein
MYALSWRVWTYQTVYPAIPFFSWIPYLGPIPSWLLFETMLVSFTLCLCGVRPKAWCGVYVLTSVLLILQDQHRLQPWAYQFMLCAAIFSWAEEEDRLPLLLVLTAGIYFHSGLQKLNNSFITGTGSVLADVFLKPFGLTAERLPYPALAALTWGMGAFELALGPGLCWAAARRRAAWAAIGMHTSILYCLVNLKWNIVVWPWNLMMMAFAWDFAGSPGAAHPRRSPVRTAVLLALALPLLRFADRFDSYPSFGMYIDYYHQSDFYVLWDSATRLPEAVRRHLEKPGVDAAGRVWNRLNLIEWSVAETEAPPYLENRDNAGVAAAVCRRFRLGDGAALEMGGLPELWSGAKRPLGVRAGCADISASADEHALNGRPVENLARAAAPALWLSVPPVEPCERLARRDAAGFTASAAAAMAPGADPAGSVRCLDAAASYFGAMRDFARAEKLYTDSLALYAASFPEEQGRRDSLRALAIVYAYQGRFADAERLLRDWREDSRLRFGPEEPNEAFALQSLALLAGAQGRTGEARELYSRSIDLYRKLLPYHPGVSQGETALATLSKKR